MLSYAVGCCAPEARRNATTSLLPPMEAAYNGAHPSRHVWFRVSGALDSSVHDNDVATFRYKKRSHHTIIFSSSWIGTSLQQFHYHRHTW